jgi:hypothetical protein
MSNAQSRPQPAPRLHRRYPELRIWRICEHEPRRLGNPCGHLRPRRPFPNELLTMDKEAHGLLIRARAQIKDMLATWIANRTAVGCRGRGRSVRLLAPPSDSHKEGVNCFPPRGALFRF